MRVLPGTYSTGYNEHVHEEANIFGKLTAYETLKPICMSFVFSAVVIFIDHYCAGVSNEHCLLSFFHCIY